MPLTSEIEVEKTIYSYLLSIPVGDFYWEKCKQTLNNTVRNLEDAVDELLEEIDLLIGEHDDFIRSEGTMAHTLWKSINIRKS